MKTISPCFAEIEALQKELAEGIEGDIREDIKGLIRKKNEEFAVETVETLEKLRILTKAVRKQIEGTKAAEELNEIDRAYTNKQAPCAFGCTKG